MSLSLMFDGDIELNSDTSEDDGYRFELLPSSRRGSPVPVEVTFASFLRDGSIVGQAGHENREMILQVRVTAPDRASLNLGEKRLNLATGKRTTLVWAPDDDGTAAQTVFEVLTSNLIEPEWDDLAEIRNQRTYGLRLVCLPFGRSVDKFTDDAGTPASTGTIADPCEATSGWSSRTGSAAPAVDSVIFAQGTGSIKCEAYTKVNLVNEYGLDYTEARHLDAKTGLSIATGAGGYLSVLIRFDWTAATVHPVSAVNGIRQTVGGVASEVAFSAVETLPSGFVRYSWPVAASLTVTALDFDISQRTRNSTLSTPFVRYDSITLSAAATTDQQIVKVFEVPGSARAPGSLYISSPSDSVALGQVFAASAREADIVPGFRPDGRRWVAVGSATGTGAPIHGSYYDLSASPKFDVPVSMLTAGPHTIVALVKHTSDPMVVGVNSQLRVGGTLTGPISAASVSVPNAAPLNGTWRFVVLGTVYLPPLPMQSPATDAFVRVGFDVSNVYLSDFYMVPGAADFSIVDCGSSAVSGSGSSSHLWIDSPDTEQPRGGWWRGPAAQRANARSAWPDVKKPGRHIYSPGRMVAWVSTTNAQGPRATLEGNKWWFGNAGE